MTNASTISPTIEWDYGTAYEFFISLHVLHQPEHFGIRASWAAGVRSRIPSAERKLLEDIYSLTGVDAKVFRLVQNMQAEHPARAQGCDYRTVGIKADPRLSENDQIAGSGQGHCG